MFTILAQYICSDIYSLFFIQRPNLKIFSHRCFETIDQLKISYECSKFQNIKTELGGNLRIWQQYWSLKLFAITLHNSISMEVRIQKHQVKPASSCNLCLSLLALRVATQHCGCALYVRQQVCLQQASEIVTKNDHNSKTLFS